MKRRIVSLLTALIMAFTIFAVPAAEAVAADTTEPYSIAEDSTAIDETDGTGSLIEEGITDPADPSEPTDPADPTEPTEPETPAEPEDPVNPEEPTEPETPVVPAEPVSLKGATVTISQKTYGFTKNAVKPKVTVKVNDKTLKQGTDFKVTYSNNIYPGTAKIKVTGINDYKGTVTKTFGIATVNGLKWVKSTTSSIKLKWTARKNVTGYKIQRYNFSKKKWVLVKTVKTNETTVKNLIPGTGYQLRVIAYYKEGNKVYNAPASAVNKVPTKPNKVIQKKLENHPALYANISWGKRNSSGYQVQYSKYATFKNSKSVKVTSATKLNKKITGLADNQQYYVRVRAYKTYGNKTTYSVWSKSKAFATNGTRWYNKNGKKYYYEDGKLFKGTKMFGQHQYYFNEEDGAWSGASPKMWRKVKDSYSNTKYLIAVSRELNRLCLYEGKKGNWILKDYWMVSTGRPENGSISKTPTGSWLMPKEDNHLGYIGGHKDYTCWYATRFYKRCFFHSVTYQPASKTEKLDPRLGMNISDGCIRMDIDNAKWIYDNCHTGTRVIVY